MGLMDSINVQYIWKAIQESERSDENLYPNATLSDRLFQPFHSEPERGAGVEHPPSAPPLCGHTLSDSPLGSRGRPREGVRGSPTGRLRTAPVRVKPDASSPSRR